MLAAITDYFHAWQVVPILIFTVGSVGVGSWLLLKSMKARPEFRRPRLGRCVGIMLVALVAGTMSAGAFFLLVYGIGVASDANLKIAAAVVAMVMAVPAVLATMYAMLDVPFASAMKMAARPVLVMLVIGAPLGADALFRTRSQVSRERRAAECRYNLTVIYSALQAYQHSYGDPAPDLATLAATNQIESRSLSCPGHLGKAIGYFYVQARVPSGSDQPASIVACDLAGNHPGGRNVLLSNGATMFDSVQDFDEQLKEGQNHHFAEALKAAQAE